MHNVSLIPSDNPMTLAEGVKKMVRCVVNSNAVPAPTITWYLGSTDITNMAGSNASSIIITMNREHNIKTLACKATNNNKPSKTVATTLNVECKFFYRNENKKPLRLNLNISYIEHLFGNAIV